MAEAGNDLTIPNTTLAGLMDEGSREPRTRGRELIQTSLSRLHELCSRVIDTVTNIPSVIRPLFVGAGRDIDPGNDAIVLPSFEATDELDGSFLYLDFGSGPTQYKVASMFIDRTAPGFALHATVDEQLIMGVQIIITPVDESSLSPAVSQRLLITDGAFSAGYGFYVLGQQVDRGLRSKVILAPSARDTRIDPKPADPAFIEGRAITKTEFQDRFWRLQAFEHLIQIGLSGLALKITDEAGSYTPGYALALGGSAELTLGMRDIARVKAPNLTTRVTVDQLSPSLGSHLFPELPAEAGDKDAFIRQLSGYRGQWTVVVSEEGTYDTQGYLVYRIALIPHTDSIRAIASSHRPDLLSAITLFTSQRDERSTHPSGLVVASQIGIKRPIQLSIGTPDATFIDSLILSLGQDLRRTKFAQSIRPQTSSF